MPSLKLIIFPNADPEALSLLVAFSIPLKPRKRNNVLHVVPLANNLVMLSVVLSQKGATCNNSDCLRSIFFHRTNDFYAGHHARLWCADIGIDVALPLGSMDHSDAATFCNALAKLLDQHKRQRVQISKMGDEAARLQSDIRIALKGKDGLSIRLDDNMRQLAQTQNQVTVICSYWSSLGPQTLAVDSDVLQTIVLTLQYYLYLFLGHSLLGQWLWRVPPSMWPPFTREGAAIMCIRTERRNTQLQVRWFPFGVVSLFSSGTQTTTSWFLCL